MAKAIEAAKKAGENLWKEGAKVGSQAGGVAAMRLLSLAGSLGGQLAKEAGERCLFCRDWLQSCLENSRLC